MRRFARRFLIFFAVMTVVFASVPVNSIYALDATTTSSSGAAKCDKAFYSSNDILFYSSCATACSGGAGGSIKGPAPSALTGADNPEKAWNYFTARGLTPVAAAGAMGNIKSESSFSASVNEASGGGGLGIIQWTGSRRTNLESAAAAAGVNLSDNDSALLFELNYLWDGEYNATTWQEQVNAETTVEGDTTIASFSGGFSSKRALSQAGNGSTMVFHALVERSGDVPTEADRVSGKGVLTGRIDNANIYLKQFGGGSSTGNCSVSTGGLTWEQAVAIAKKLSDDWTGVYCGSGSIKGGFYCDWTSGYCTAGAAWMAVTTAPDDPSKVPGIPNGVDVANRLISGNPDVYAAANPDGSNLQPFSVWSFGEGSASGQPGHTGTIVNVGSDGSIITLETNWSGKTATSTKDFLYNSGHKVAVFEYPSFDAFKNSHNGYVYTATATPKDAATAAKMATKMAPFIPGGTQ
ncbi:hypothetical protein H7100_02455 [Candidatus Saccharibacteria bacterium]|nr:hypothetical protein [Candidatus Saccharibacteria bacterium]